MVYDMVFLGVKICFPLCLVMSGIQGQVITPLSVDVAVNEGTSLVCTTSATASISFVWTHVTTSTTIYSGGQKFPPSGTYENFDLNEDIAAKTSTLIINNIQLLDRGEYQCIVAQQPLEPTAAVNVEVGSELRPLGLISIDSDTNYQATCEAIGSLPEETITWILDGEVQTAPSPDIVETDPQISDDALFDKRSVFTFPATFANYNKRMECNISGHQVSSLNRQVSRLIDIHNPPEDNGIEISFNSDGTNLVVSCDINPAVDPAIPAMDMFYIYENGTLRSKPLSDSRVTVTEPEQETEYRCVGLNYLGNTTAIDTFLPGRTTTPPKSELTEGTTSDPNSEEPTLTEGTTSEPRSEEPSPSSCTCDGLSSGASAGIAILAILLAGSIIINVTQFIVWRRHSKRAEKTGSQKVTSSEVRVGSLEANDNMAYEMIQSGERAYTALKLSSSGTSRSTTVDPENVTFFTRLGSIGRGDFGAVWKGELRSNQGRAAVAIRQIPDSVSKSTNLLQSVKVLSGLSDQPNVVKCLGFCQEQNSIVYEFISGGTLLTHLQMTGVQSQPTYGNLKPNRVRIDEGSLLNFAWQIAKGMHFLASKKIIHGTLCAHNVLVGDRKQCKLSDYGLASSLFSNKGKPTRWSSPEMMVTCIHSAEGDIWSFGIVLWEIVTLGARPYPNMTFDTVQKEVSEGYKMPRPRHCGHELYAIMNRCWETEGRNRISFDEIPKTLERILEKTHDYLSLNDLDRDLYASPQDV